MRSNYGGGVCQLSSTLYNAIVKADLEVVYRRNHSMPVSYVKEGLDATINSVGNIIDFKFKNNTAGDIIVIALYDQQQQTRVRNLGAAVFHHGIRRDQAHKLSRRQVRSARRSGDH